MFIWDKKENKIVASFETFLMDSFKNHPSKTRFKSLKKNTAHGSEDS